MWCTDRSNEIHFQFILAKFKWTFWELTKISEGEAYAIIILDMYLAEFHTHYAGLFRDFGFLDRFLYRNYANTQLPTTKSTIITIIL